MRLRVAPALVAALGASLAFPASPSALDAADLAQVRADAVRWAVAQKGLRERGTTNCSPTVNAWVKDMGLRPCKVWCGAFVHQAFLQAGLRLSSRLIDPHKTYYDVLANRRGLRQVAISDVGPGDLLLYAFRRRLTASPFAIVVTRLRKGWVTTAEGNVGHTAVVKRRSLRFPVLAARVVGHGA